MNKIIAVDFDGVMNNMLEEWIKRLNKLSNRHYIVEDIKDWEIAHYYPELSYDSIFSVLYQIDFWDNVKEKEDCAKYLKYLLYEGYQIIVVTNSHYKTLQFKLDYCLFKLFPFLTQDDIIITSNKNLIKSNYFIDDYEANLKCINPEDCTRILFSYPYNENASEKSFDFRANNWKEIYDLIHNDSKIRE